MDATRINYYLAGLLALVIVAALGRQLLTAYSTYQFSPDQSTSVSQARVATDDDYQASTIASSYLFGRPSGDQQIAGQSDFPATNMQLILRGAFTSTNPERGSAIIEGPDGQTRAYRVGNRLYGQAELRQVYADRVVLSRNGELETLQFPVNQPSSDEDSGSSRNTAAELEDRIPDGIRRFVQDNMSQQEIDQTVTQLSSAAMTPEQRQALIRQRLQDLRNRAREKR
ncbi:MAG: type II secretion system protein N [Oceanicoccus sp.]